MKPMFNVFRRLDAQLEFTDKGPSGSTLCRMVTEAHSDNMGAGMFRIHQNATTVTLPYTEIAICLEGTLILTVDGERNELSPGDFALIPEGTELTFDGENAVSFYSVHPVDWRALKGETL